MHSIRNVFDLWNSTLQDAFIPCENLTVDEQLLAFPRWTFFQSMQAVKTLKVPSQIIGYLRQSSRPRIETGHLQKQKEPSEQIASNSVTTFALNYQILTYTPVTAIALFHK